ncbi:MAG: CaiB/BaiF CoA-transferase family protein [Candidatus Phosphoribacter sp.]|nr:CoA transferase [Actinomycetales bacterium]
MTTTPPVGPLAGVRIVELAGIGPGPFAGMILADLGADVIGVDRPGGAGPFDLPVLRRGRRSICIDLKSAAGRDVVLDLIEGADALVEPYRPGVMERLGLGPEVALARNPRLVYARMTGWGQDGPQAPYAGHDLTYTATAGLLSGVVRDTHDGSVPRPVLPGPYLGDVAGGALLLVAGLLAALHEAVRSGVGQVVDAAIVDGASYLTTFTHALADAGMWAQPPGNNVLDTGAPFYEVYECADRRHLAVAALEPQFYAELLALLGEHAGLDLADDDPRRPEHRLDQRRWPEAKSLWEKLFRTRTRDEWCAVLERSDACVAPVLALSEAPEHAHLATRAAYGVVGGPTLPVPAPRFSRTPSAPRPVVAPGTHTDDVLAELGYDATRIAALRAAGEVS